MTSAPPADDVEVAPNVDDVFDDPSCWRLAAVRRLGLSGEDRIAGVITGAAYPDALAPIVRRLLDVRGTVCDLGAGLGGASQWLAEQTGAGVVALEPQAASVRAAADLFPGLAIVQSAATAIPLGSGCAAAVTLLGVLSLVDDLGVVLAEVARVLAPGGVVGITDLCAVGEDRRDPDGSPNVFRSADLLSAALATHGARVTDRWTAPAGMATRWDDVGRQVDDEITRRYVGDPAFGAWRADRARLADDIDRRALVVETLIAEMPSAGA